MTLPAPAGVAHVPSPRQNVVEEAPLPEFKFPTGRFPLTSVVRATAPKLGRPEALPKFFFGDELPWFFEEH